MLLGFILVKSLDLMWSDLRFATQCLLRPIFGAASQANCIQSGAPFLSQLLKVDYLLETVAEECCMASS